MVLLLCRKKATKLFKYESSSYSHKKKKYCLSGKLISQNKLWSVICKTTILLTAALKNNYFFPGYCKLWERWWVLYFKTEPCRM